MRLLRRAGGQKGVTMLELAIASAVIGFTLLVSLRVFRVILKGQSVSRSTLRADNLLVSSLDDIKNAATRASYDGTWTNITNSPTALSYSASTIVYLGGQKYTLRILPEWVNISATLTPVATTTAVIQALTPIPVFTTPTTTSSMIRFTGTVTWTDYYGPKTITKTAYSTYLRQ